MSNREVPFYEIKKMDMCSVDLGLEVGGGGREGVGGGRLGVGGRV